LPHLPPIPSYTPGAARRTAHGQRETLLYISPRSTRYQTPQEPPGAAHDQQTTHNQPTQGRRHRPTQGRTAPPTCRRWTGGPAADAGHLQPPHSGRRKATAYTIKPGTAPGSAHRPPAQHQPGHDPPPRTSSRPPATPGSAPPTLDTAHAAEERPQQTHERHAARMQGRTADAPTAPPGARQGQRNNI